VIEVRRLLSALSDVEVIAKGPSIRELKWLNHHYGKGNWRKLKGIARVEDTFGAVYTAEVHWYEAHGIGKRKIKVKRPLD
jgi:hypothetical protein